MTTRPLPGEFELIERFLAPLAAGAAGAQGLRNDAARIDPPPGEALIVTKDLMVGGVHFPLDEAPGNVAAKLLRVNLSDLAAMGAQPLGYLMGLALPGEIDLDWMEQFTAALAADQACFGLSLLGGDTVRTPGPLCLSLTALGSAPAGRELMRDGAKPGDLIVVSGTVGDGALGLALHQGALGALDEHHATHLRERFRRPEPRLGLGIALRGLAHAAIDVSDGLIADLGHITEASGVGARIEAAEVPLSDAARAVLAIQPARLNDCLSGGDDYELLFTLAPAEQATLDRLATELGLSLAVIGRVEAEAGVRVTAPDGTPLTLDRAGYRHF
jgi:thiamine-monophosphate kinase